MSGLSGTQRHFFSCSLVIPQHNGQVDGVLHPATTPEPAGQGVPAAGPAITIRLADGAAKLIARAIRLGPPPAVHGPPVGATGQGITREASRSGLELPLTCIVGFVRFQRSRRVGPVELQQLAHVQEIVSHPRCKQVPSRDRAPGCLVGRIPVWRR